jgi:class 3 adenylate cyclase
MVRITLTAYSSHMQRNPVSHLGTLAKTLVGVWLVVWAGGLTLYVSQATRTRILPPMLVVSTPDGPEDFPTIRGVRPLQGSLSDVVAGDPRPETGDRILRVGQAGLGGADQLRFQALAVSQTGPDLRLPLRLEREGEILETWIEAPPSPSPWWQVPGALAFGLTGLVLIVRAPRSPAARFLAAGAMAFSLKYVRLIDLGTGPSELHYAGVALLVGALTISNPCFLTGLLFFPDDCGPRRERLLWPWVFALMGAAVAGKYTNSPIPMELAVPLLAVLNVAVAVAALAILTRKFLAASPIGRRRIKWVIIGVYLAAVPHACFWFVNFLNPTLTAEIWQSEGVSLAFAPVAVLVAIVRFNLFDIDRLVSATAAYTIVGIALLGGLIAAVPPAAAAISSWVGVGTGGTQVALSLIAAAVAVPIAQRLRPEIERVFFPDRYRMEQGTRELIDQLSDCHEPRQLIGLAGERLTELLRPESCVVYGRREGGFSPIFVWGRGGPPGFEATSTLVGVLEQRAAPLAMDRFARRGATPAPTPFDRAAMETLEAAVVVPIHRRGAGMVGLVCLGPKLSGDVYTSTDLTLLAALSDKVSSELLRFEQEEVTRQADALRENLRVYVPGAVQEQLARLGEPAAGERDVTVLFVDIRAYTAFAQDRDAAEVFSTINRYTQAVSEIVRKHEGNVVEFNGDGMMAVFGAPRDLPGKEREAVNASLEILETMGTLGLVNAEGEVLSVGVGVATGPAFVGSVQAADRAIWTALGNTTNLASRLQSLTRDLDAAIVIDAATRQAAGPVADDFEKRERVEIRGRREPEDLYIKKTSA